MCPRRSVLFISALLLGLQSASAQTAPLWTSPFNAPGNNADNAYAMAIDRWGNVHVAGDGRTGSTTTDSVDFVTVKYAPTGDTLWARFYNGTGNRRDVARAIAVDNEGNVYVAGESYGTVDYDIVVVKYNAAGVQRWAMRYNGPANGADGAFAIALDSAGNVIVTGYSDGDASTVTRQDDFVTIKVDSTGVQQWGRRYNGPGNFHDVAHAVGTDLLGSIFVAGESVGSGTRYDYVTIKYTPAGDTAWVRRYNGPANYDDKIYSLAVSRTGEAFVTGSSDGSSSDNEDFATIKYSSSGVESWVARYAGPGGGDEAFAIAVDSAGENFYVTGESRAPASPFSYDYLTIRYNAATGDTLWTARYNGPGNGLDLATSVANDRSGNVFVTGYSTGSGSGLDIATISYDPSGGERWKGRYTSAGVFTDIGIVVGWDRGSGIYVAATSNAGAEGTNIVALKYAATPSAVDVESGEVTMPGDVLLLQNFPNPFNPQTRIELRTKNSEFLILKVFDMLGREVATLLNEQRAPGVHSVDFDGSGLSSGVYFYRLIAGSVTQTRSFVLLR